MAKMKKVSKTTKGNSQHGKTFPKRQRGSSPLSFGRLVSHFGHFDQFGHFLLLWCKPIGICLWLCTPTTETDQIGRNGQDEKKSLQDDKWGFPKWKENLQHDKGEFPIVFWSFTLILIIWTNLMIFCCCTVKPQAHAYGFTIQEQKMTKLAKMANMPKTFSERQMGKSPFVVLDTFRSFWPFWPVWSFSVVVL